MKMAVTSLYPILHSFFVLVFVASLMSNGGMFHVVASGVTLLYLFLQLLMFSNCVFSYFLKWIYLNNV